MYAFWLHYFDKITRIETGNIVDQYGEFVDPGTSPNPFAVYNEVTNENANSMDLLGIEFRGNYQVNPSLKSGLTFTYTWGNLTNKDGSVEPADRVPPANGIFFIDYTPIKKLTIRPQARYAFAHRRISPGEMGDIRISQNGNGWFCKYSALYKL